MGENIGLILIIVLVVVLVLWAISTYNKLIRTREMVRNAMGQISAQIESRWDALKNMIDATKQYADFEANTLESIIEQRTSLNKNANVKDVNEDEDLFNQTMGRIFAIAENYPELKASHVYQDTIANVDRYEQHVRQSRMIYNDTVTKYNRVIQSVPSNIIASMFKFTEEGYFEHSQAKTDMPSWS